MSTGSFIDAHRSSLSMFSSVYLFQNFDFAIVHIEKLDWHHKL